MRTMVAALFLFFSLPLQAQPSPACDAPEHRQFDFWIGEWRVESPEGKLLGRNSIRRELEGCVLHERWKGVSGFSGESFNVYDRTRGVWHQTWVDQGGTLLLLEGGLEGKAMRLAGDGTGRGGEKVHQRITWTPIDSEECRACVRQLWERQEGGGEWTIVFEGVYRKE